MAEKDSRPLGDRLRAFLIGERVYLRPLEPGDADGEYPHWLNDAEACRGNSHHAFPNTRAATLEYIADAGRSRSSLVLAIVRQADHRHVGNIALQAIHPIYRSAELAILIGDRESWGQGYGEEAARLIIGHGFRALNLHRIHCGTFATNVGMQKLAQKLGMIPTGRHRQAAFKDGAYVDVLLYDLLRDEFGA